MLLHINCWDKFAHSSTSANFTCSIVTILRRHFVGGECTPDLHNLPCSGPGHIWRYNINMSDLTMMRGGVPRVFWPNVNKHRSVLVSSSFHSNICNKSLSYDIQNTTTYMFTLLPKPISAIALVPGSTFASSFETWRRNPKPETWNCSPRIQ